MNIAREVTIPVTLSSESSERWTISGTLSSSGSLAGRTVQVLLPGATYSQVYWDFPVKPERYSYVQAMNQAGYATLALDRIGHGKSSRPPGEAVTTAASAYTVHQVIQALRDGSITGVPAEQVVLVGHSYGSVVSVLEASTYNDVDAIVATGLTHTVGEERMAQVFGNFIPAVEDSDFALADVPADHLTTRTGTRGECFYYLPSVDQDVLEADERTKDTLISTGEASTLFESSNRRYSLGLSAPVLLVVGEHDGLNLLSDIEPESTCWPEDFELRIVPDSGHNLNLHHNAPDFFSLVAEWLEKRIGAFSARR